jgi:hypothetical protein
MRPGFGICFAMARPNRDQGRNYCVPRPRLWQRHQPRSMPDAVLLCGHGRLVQRSSPSFSSAKRFRGLGWSRVRSRSMTRPFGIWPRHIRSLRRYVSYDMRFRNCVSNLWQSAETDATDACSQHLRAARVAINRRTRNSSSVRRSGFAALFSRSPVGRSPTSTMSSRNSASRRRCRATSPCNWLTPRVTHI